MRPGALQAVVDDQILQRLGRTAGDGDLIGADARGSRERADDRIRIRAECPPGGT